MYSPMQFLFIIMILQILLSQTKKLSRRGLFFDNSNFFKLFSFSNRILSLKEQMQYAIYMRRIYNVHIR